MEVAMSILLIGVSSEECRVRPAAQGATKSVLRSTKSVFRWHQGVWMQELSPAVNAAPLVTASNAFDAQGSLRRRVGAILGGEGEAASTISH